MRDRPLLVWGAGLVALSLALSVLNATLLPQVLLEGGTVFGDALADSTLVVYSVSGWLQQGTLVLGAALVAAHALLRQLVPLPVEVEPDVDEYR